MSYKCPHDLEASLKNVLLKYAPDLDVTAGVLSKEVTEDILRVLVNSSDGPFAALIGQNVRPSLGHYVLISDLADDGGRLLVRILDPDAATAYHVTYDTLMTLWRGPSGRYAQNQLSPVILIFK